MQQKRKLISPRSAIMKLPHNKKAGGSDMISGTDSGSEGTDANASVANHLPMDA